MRCPRFPTSDFGAAQYLSNRKAKVGSVKPGAPHFCPLPILALLNVSPTARPNLCLRIPDKLLGVPHDRNASSTRGLRCNGNAKRGAKKTLGLCGWTSQERETFTDCEKSLP